MTADTHLSSDTVVIQAYPNHRPAWVERCITSVREWAELSGYDYFFYQESEKPEFNGFYSPLGGYVPEWFAAKSREYPYPVFDLARAEAATRLHKTYHRVIWVDGDVLIFAPERFRILDVGDAAFTREIWVLWVNGQHVVRQRVTNCVCCYTRDSVVLQQYKIACLQLGTATEGQFAKSDIGTDLLTELHRHSPLPLLPNIGNCSPHVLHALVAADADRLTTFIARTGQPLYAANLCASHQGRRYFGVRNDEQHYERAVHLLLSQPDLLSPR